MKSNEHGIVRRDFLQGGIGSVVAFGCFTAAELKAARATAQTSRKPVLTRDSLMAHIPPPSQVRQRQTMAAALTGTIANYLEQNFELTPNQKRNIRSMSAQTQQGIQQALNKAIADHMTIEVQELQAPVRSKAESTRTSKETILNGAEGQGCQVQTRFTPTALIIEIGKPR